VAFGITGILAFSLAVLNVAQFFYWRNKVQQASTYGPLGGEVN
jgi:hypothetical protein